MALQPAFNVKLNHKIIVGTVCVGEFDGTIPSLVAATTTGKVLIHTTQGSGYSQGGRLTSEEGDVSLLNVNQDVQALSTGQLNPELNRDVLVIGTPSHILAYDVYNNSDLFHIEVPDGVNCITIGKLGNIPEPLALIGGNCAIQGFDATGNDLFWTVTGDNVCCLCLCDFDGDGENELIVGSEDFEIRIYKNDDIVSEITETESVSHLMTLSVGKQFAYALDNGTLGLYEGNKRVWRIKSKNHVTSIVGFDINGDGQLELVTGWSNGKIDFRLCNDGDVLFKEQLGSCIAGFMVADYRQDGHLQVVAASTDGHVCGYLAITEGGGKFLEQDPNQEIIREFSQQKQNILLELKNYEENQKASLMDRPSGLGDLDRDQMGIIPANTQLQTMLYINSGTDTEEPCVELHVETSNDTCVRAVLLFAEGIFPGESFVMHPKLNDISNELRIKIRPQRDIPVDMHIKALIGYKNSVQYHVFELPRHIPRFSMYARCQDNVPLPESHVIFTVNQRMEKMLLWLQENFLVDAVEIGEKNEIDVSFIGLRNPTVVGLNMNSEGEVTIHCEDIEISGEIVQSMALFFGMDELKSTAVFPLVVSEINSLLEKADEIYSVRERLSADMADQSGMIKALLIRGEESRLMKNTKSMKKHYNELYKLNQEMFSQYKVRSNNHQELISNMKMVNRIIQSVGKLRVGHAKTDVINACRTAIKESHYDILPRIIKVGNL